ncbi:hypothetical protein GGH94_003104 [Coemansia aciculifera]|uniref:Uncharacterized protein n=1 Tax=Coemansia aciculifera TaxID=417176 RepID=A0A9W8II20_9FUNG|nr:hypothetical protein GGH94_003104 [Coemansia aciculifera]
MADDNTDNNNMNNSDGVDCGGLQSEQSFETLLYSANHNRTPEDYERSQLAMEKKREALTTKWAARLIGKTLVGAEPAPVFAPRENDVEDDEHNADNNKGEAEAEAGDNGSGDDTTGAEVDKNSVVGTGDDYEAEEDKEDGSEEVDSDFDGDSDDRFFSLASLPANRRILYGQNAPMTMDYHPDRLNVVLDDNGVCIEVFFV